MNKLFPIGGNVLIVTISILINKDVFEPSYTPWKESYDQPRQHILQASLQQYVNCELPDVQAGFRKCRGTRDQIANICWSSKKQDSPRKTSISALLTMPKPLTVWITINCGKF